MTGKTPRTPSPVAETEISKRVHCRDWLKRRMARAVGTLQKPDWRTLDSMVLPDEHPR